jgi:hypothetical protein
MVAAGEGDGGYIVPRGGERAVVQDSHGEPGKNGTIIFFCQVHAGSISRDDWRSRSGEGVTRGASPSASASEMSKMRNEAHTAS